jgi:hypothetical protein
MEPSQPANSNRAAARGKFPWQAFLRSRNFYLIIYQYFACKTSNRDRLRQPMAFALTFC